MMNARDEVAKQIGTLVLANVELSAQAEAMQKLVVSRHELLAQLIRSDSLPHEQAQEIMADEVFAAWYRKAYK